ncbi:MAG: flavin reductase [Candidatus Poseidoniaceae archaeon]|nr:flavin reductase [Candidatus Poseidoniaceae archaeon]
MAAFLERCIAYAASSIERKNERGEDASDWEAYRAHTAFALDEVRAGRLDAWFDGEDSTEPARTPLRLTGERAVTRLDQLEHRERARLLASTLSPRPLVLVATTDASGRHNLAPMTSLSVVSNSPPLVVMSLSSDREGRARDTLLNLRDKPSATLYLLLSGPDDAALVEHTAPNVPRGTSEWDAVPHTVDEEGVPYLDRAAAALRVTMVEERALPDAVARLVIFNVDEVHLPSSALEAEALDVLCQHGLDRLMASPTGWSQVVDHRSA